MAGVYTTVRLGLAATLTDDVPGLLGLLGRPPFTLRRFVEEHRACWTAVA